MKKHQFKFSNGYIVELQSITPNVFGQNVALRVLKEKKWAERFVFNDNYTGSTPKYIVPTICAYTVRNSDDIYKVLFEATLYASDIRKVLYSIKQSYKEKEIHGFANVGGGEYINLMAYNSKDFIWFNWGHLMFSFAIRSNKGDVIFDVIELAPINEVLEFGKFVENLFNYKKEEKMENEKDEVIIGNSKNKIYLRKINDNEYDFRLYNRIIRADNSFYYENANVSTLSKADIKNLVQFFNSFIEDEKAKVPGAKLYELLEKLPAGWSISRGEKHECKDDILYLTKDTGGNVCVNRLPYFVPEALKLLNQYHKTIPFGKELERQKIKLKFPSASPLNDEIYDVVNYFIGESCLHGTLIVEEYINFKNCRTGELRIMDKRTYEEYYKVV